MFKRGDVYYTDLGEGRGSIQGGKRPVLVISNDVGNYYSSTIMVCPITSKHKDLNKGNIQPTHVKVGSPMHRESLVLTEQIFTLDKNIHKLKFIGRLTDAEMEMVKVATNISLGHNK